MNLSFVLVDESDRASFAGVIPEFMGFADNRVVIGAVNDGGEVLGALSYILIDYEYVIDWIYVEPSVRRQKVGSGLMETVYRVVLQTGDLFFVSARYEVTEEYKELHYFFLSCRGIDTDYSHERYLVKVDDLKKAADLNKNSEGKYNVEGFFDKTEQEQKKVLAVMAAVGGYYVDDYEAWKEQCIKELCNIIYVDNKLLDLVFVQKDFDGNLELSYLYGKDNKGLLELLLKTAGDAQSMFSDSSISFDAITEESQRVADYLFPNADKVHIYEATF